MKLEPVHFDRQRNTAAQYRVLFRLVTDQESGSGIRTLFHPNSILMIEYKTYKIKTK